MTPALENEKREGDAGRPETKDKSSPLSDNEGWQLVEAGGQGREVEEPAPVLEAEGPLWRQRLEAAADTFDAVLGNVQEFAAMAYDLVGTFQGPRI